MKANQEEREGVASDCLKDNTDTHADTVSKDVSKIIRIMQHVKKYRFL